MLRFNDDRIDAQAVKKVQMEMNSPGDILMNAPNHKLSNFQELVE